MGCEEDASLKGAKVGVGRFSKATGKRERDMEVKETKTRVQQ